ncbi:DinB family protein [Noviherbaspirillum denitrificans]|uniref:Damage-inducible protein n=1 Tax=Noviherbaspirillum denitrificans TaxID=1968433 RepID=A0A254T7C0_9BURK|nr:DinB family protein [Noviherbaspirillum denitrificans]OWW18077.1 damage-inducible protein [Noviherbaspirillum denitrificans]
MFIDIFKYKQWADRRTLDAAKSIDGQENSATTSFIRQQLNHMVIVEELFRARLIDDESSHRSTNTEIVPELNELDLRLTQSNEWFIRYVTELDLEALNDQISFQFVDGRHGRMTRQEILFHIVNHGTYHRGAIGHALDLAKAARPADTYTVFIHTHQPERRLQT